MTSVQTKERKITLVRIAHVTYQHKNIEKQRSFLEHFGFQETHRVGSKTYYSGYGDDPWVYCAIEGDEDKFLGAGFVVESEEDLVYAAESLPGSSKVYELSDAPGGGKCVTFYDPIDGFPFHLVHGQSTAQLSEPTFPKLDFNFPKEKYRGANKFQRLEKRPAPVHKLGHFGMVVTDFAKTYEFYTSRFNLIPSDIVHNETGKNVVAFTRLDRGKELVDHHTFFFFEGPKCHVHHSSFETHDFDTQLLGHDWLRNQGYENCWGVGRHIMGSQIFDYWFDPSHFIVEHYVDGDLMDNAKAPNLSLASDDNLAIWGPDLPPSFLS